ncbi:MAG TPA: hypothetical protein VLM85_27045, partial [Polyangiaceae bacterium]|nr:hypothetical protein [Polyangiaceae bacterium]
MKPSRLAFPLVIAMAAMANAQGRPPSSRPASGSATVTASGTGPAPATATASGTASTSETAEPQARGEGMRAYQDALAARKLGGTLSLNLDDVRTRAAEAEDLLRSGRIDEAVSR